MQKSTDSSTTTSSNKSCKAKIAILLFFYFPVLSDKSDDLTTDGVFFCHETDLEFRFLKIVHNDPISNKLKTRKLL